MVGVGEIEHAQFGRDRLTAEVVRRAERLLATVGEIGRERVGVARSQLWTAVGAVLGPHVEWEAYGTSGDRGPVAARRCRAGHRPPTGSWSTGTRSARRRRGTTRA